MWKQRVVINLPLPEACRVQNLLGAGKPQRHRYHDPFSRKNQLFTSSSLSSRYFNLSSHFPLAFHPIFTPQDTPQGGGYTH